MKQRFCLRYQLFPPPLYFLSRYIDIYENQYIWGFKFFSLYFIIGVPAFPKEALSKTQTSENP